MNRNFKQGSRVSRGVIKTYLILAVCLVGATLATRATGSRTAEGSPALAEVQGQIVAVQLSASTLTVKDKAEKVWTVRVDSKTRIMDNENNTLKLADLSEGKNIRVYFNTRTQLARQIDVFSGMIKEQMALD